MQQQLKAGIRAKWSKRLAVALVACVGLAPLAVASPVQATTPVVTKAPAPPVRTVRFTPEQIQYLCMLARNDAATQSGWGAKGIRRMAGTPCVPEALPAIQEAISAMVPPEWQAGYTKCATYLAIRESNLLPSAQNRVAGGLFQLHKRYYILWASIYNEQFGTAAGLPSSGDLLNPRDNALVAVFMMVHGGFRPWSPIPRVCRSLPHGRDFNSLVYNYIVSH